MVFGFFKKKPAESADASRWWADANACALQPDRGDLDVLAARVAPPADLDEHERQTEMLDALEALLSTAAAAALPILDTQHRVIGTDACHFMAPVSAPDHGDAIGKLFLTSHRVVFAGGASIAWPWHRVRRIARHDRDIVFEGGDALTLRLRCNSYTDALTAFTLAHKIGQK